jgi:hypothetical protein
MARATALMRRTVELGVRQHIPMETGLAASYPSSRFDAGLPLTGEPCLSFYVPKGLEQNMPCDDRKPGERPPKPRNTPSAKERGKPQPWLPQPSPEDTRKKS